MNKDNQITLRGNTGKDSETRQINNNYVTKFSLCTNEGYKKEGEWVNVSTWHNVEFWTQKEPQMIPKGSTLRLFGSLKYNTYEKDGVKVTLAVVRADAIELIKKSDDLPF